MKKFSFWGGVLYGGLTLFTQLACYSLAGGENLFGLLLLIPWTVAVFPLWSFYHLFGWEWRVGEYTNITGAMLLEMILINVCLGALIGVLIGKLWKLAKSYFAKS